MQLVGSRGQQQRDHLYVADGTIAQNNTSQLLLPERKSCSFLFIQNNSSGALWLEFGGARATATLTNGVITSINITNAGINYTLPPTVRFFGGGNNGNNLSPGAAIEGWPSPTDPAFAAPRMGSTTNRNAYAVAVLSGATVGSVTIEDGGAGYKVAPYVFLENNVLDPGGVADPFAGSVNSGLQLPTNGSNLYINGTFCPTDAIAIWGATAGQAFTCRWAP